MSHPNDHIRESLRRLVPYQAGKPIEEVKRELGLERVVKLASNEYPEGPFPEVVEAIQRAIPQLHRYPDPAWFELRESFARALEIEPERFFFGAGANELLELLIHLYSGGQGTVVFGVPAFPVYGIIAQSHHDVGRSVPLDADHVHDLDAMADAVGPETRIVFVCNPNNPTGTYVSHERLRAFVQRVPDDVLVVVDEAYFEFVVADDYPDVVALQREHPNLVSLRSMSKAYSLAGLRVGYAIADPSVVAMLQRVRQPFNVNRLAQIAAGVAIAQRHRVAARRTENRRRLDLLAAGMEELGCTVVPSQANFLLAFAPDAADEVFPRLLREGVIVRPMHTTFGLEAAAFRVNTGTEDENAFFLAALRRVLTVEDSLP